MTQKKRERERKEKKFEEPDVKEIIRQIEDRIEDSIGKASQTSQASPKDIEEYEIIAIAEKVRKTREREHQIAKEEYRKAYEAAKRLAALFSKGEAKYLNRWG